MDIHEYQAKKILESYGILVPPFAVVSSLEELKQIPFEEAVVKIQVHAGGRGKAGGVRFAKGKKEIEQVTKELLGMEMSGAQTAGHKIKAEKVLLSAPVSIDKEYYLGATIDREKGKAFLIASPEGGMDIEEVAKKSPEKILKVPITLEGKIRSFHLLRLAKCMGWKGDMAKEGTQIAQTLAKIFLEKDASLIEINPLVLSEGRLLALDAKLSVDDNALFRQEELANFYDPMQISHQERKAKEKDLSYIALDGNIGCMVNGAGLAMATMDLIDLYGGKPANFLDVGGGASKEKVAAGFTIILEDSKVKAILINIFGGIMDCAVLAEGIIAAATEVHVRVPLIVRMEGTNADEGKSILQRANLQITVADSLEEAAKKAVSAS